MFTRFAQRILTAGAALSLLVIAPVHSQQEAEDEWFVGPMDEPQISVFNIETVEVDLGIIDDTKKVTARFPFRNDGAVNLVIAGIKTDCGCTHAPLEKREYAPGEEGVIELVFNPQGRSGPQRKTALVTTNDPKNPVVKLLLTTDIRLIVWADPAKAITDPALIRGGDTVKTITIMSQAEHFKVLGIEVQMPDGTPAPTDEGFISATIGATEVIEVDGKETSRTLVEVTIAGSAPVGWLHRQLRINVEAWDETDESAPAEMPEPGGAEQDQADDAESAAAAPDDKPAEESTEGAVPEPELSGVLIGDREHVVRLQIVVQLLGDLVQEERLMQLGILKAGQPFNSVITIASRTGTPFRILDVTSQGEAHGGFKFEYDVTALSEPGVEKRIITIHGTAPMQTGMVKGQLVIKTDIQGEETLRHNFRGSVRNPE
ncbi:MAG: DUF1573 domain-containing protein [Phycisphaerales bacterium]|nr:DUF1573 domain-containing protein [Phycisphaerales bacterium]